MTPVDLPVVPVASVQLGAGVRIRDYLGLTDRKERVVALVALGTEEAIALGTRQGVVKRIAPSALPAKPEFEVIALKKDDEVVGARQGAETDELVFVTSEAQLLHFPAVSVRPQGIQAGGVAGVFLGPDFVTVTKTEDSDWAHIKPAILGAIMEHYQSGLPAIEGGRAVYSMTPEAFAAFLPKLIEAGASFVGGCCGTSPAFIRELARVAESCASS